jgi:hypothetical protein
MHNLFPGQAGPAGAAFTPIRQGSVEHARPEHISKLVLSSPRDRHLIEAVAGYPARLQSCVLSAWLRGGWRITRSRPGAAQPIPPPVPSSELPAARVTRRIRFDDPVDPALAGFLGSLPRKERGREIRQLIWIALRSCARHAL